MSDWPIFTSHHRPVMCQENSCTRTSSPWGSVGNTALSQQQYHKHTFPTITHTQVKYKFSDFLVTFKFWACNNRSIKLATSRDKSLKSQHKPLFDNKTRHKASLALDHEFWSTRHSKVLSAGGLLEPAVCLKWIKTTTASLGHLRQPQEPARP